MKLWRNWGKPILGAGITLLILLTIATGLSYVYVFFTRHP